jgi:antitoxin HicB
MTEGIELPEPSKARRREHLVASPAETMAKAALFVAMLQAGSIPSADSLLTWPE